MLTLTCEAEIVNPAEADDRPSDADRAWWAAQNDEGGEAEGESYPFDLAGDTASAWEWRLDLMAAESGVMDAMESGLAMW